MRIMIGEDEALLRQGLTHVLEHAGHDVVGTAVDAEDLVRQTGERRPDLVVTDIRMPPGFSDEGLVAALRLHRSGAVGAIVVLTQHVHRRYARELLAERPTGVGYLLKQRISDVATFVADLERVAGGGTVLDPEIIALMMARARRDDDALDRLTPRQQEVLALMAAGRTNAAIGRRLSITEKAVVGHVSRIYDALCLAPGRRRPPAGTRGDPAPGAGAGKGPGSGVARGPGPLAHTGPSSTLGGVTSRTRTLAATVAVAASVALLSACAPAPGPAASGAPPGAPAPPVLTPVVAAVPYASVPVLGDDDRTHLVYELSLTNFTSGTVTVDEVDEVDVVDPASGATVLTYAGATLASRLRPLGGDGSGAALTAGRNGTLFVHVPMAGGAPVPQRLTHRVAVTVAGQQAVEENVGATPVTQRRLPVLGPPLRGEGYIVGDGCCDAVRHTRAQLPINGTPMLAQRFAIDYEQVGAGGRIYSGDKTNPASYRIFGEEIVAVADGTVVDSHDGEPEQVPGTYPTGIPIDRADGNFVLLDIGDGNFVTFAHMQPGSVRVRPGDAVRRGDVLGLVGNTGNSVAPHLHIHVTDGPSPVGSQGLPYLVDRFTVTGRIVDTAAFDAAESDGTPVALVPGVPRTGHTGRLPTDMEIVDF